MFNGFLQLFFALNLFALFANGYKSKVSILFSNREPFVTEDEMSGVPRGLDVSIMENFARKYNLKTEYIRSNQALNLALFSEEAFNEFSQNKSLE